MTDTEEFKLEPIAIIGMSCRFPGAGNINKFWENLKNGVESITDIPPDRWDKDEFYSAENAQIGKMNTQKAGFLDQVDLFDADFFGISSEEADSLDPQQRLLMEVSYEALEDAGLKVKSLKNSKVGVFIGISSHDYGPTYINHINQMNMYSVSGFTASVASNRISYFFDFKSPSISIDTACSSSLTAIHLACQSIRLRESNMAIVGGVNVILSPFIAVGFSQTQGTSPNGKCSAFDANANGMVRGEGCGIVILKPLSKALKDGDKIYSVIRGSAVNQDGQTNGLLAPSSEGQKEVIQTALECSQVNPEEITFIEAHGTGTILGDPIETKALGEILKNNGNNTVCKIGSVKTNLGHLEAGAGIAGLIKASLCLKNGYLVPSLNYHSPNPYIDFDKLNLKVQTQLEKLNNEKIIAGVSSFGFGGTNAHVILENYTQEKSIKSESLEAYLLPLTGHSYEAVQDACKNYLNFLSNESVNLKDLCSTATLKRDFHNFRTSFSFNSQEDLLNQLKDIDNQNIYSVSRKKPKVCFVFSGMGSQQAGMGKELLKYPVFLETIKKCDQLMQAYLDWSLLDQIANNYSEPSIERVQPVLFALQIGLAAIWKSYGINPDSVVGSSVGEVASAYISGAISLEDAVKIICLRNNSMIKMIGKGAMAIVQLAERQTEEIIKDFDNVYISALNSSSMTILSGEEKQLEKVLKIFNQKEIFSKIVKGAVAPSHCDLMEPVKQEILTNLAEIKAYTSNIEIYSTVTAKKEDGQIFTNQYWWDNVKSPIRFLETIKEIEKSGRHIYIEISPHPVLSYFINDIISEMTTKSIRSVSFPSLKKDNSNQLLQTLGNIFSLGLNINWQELYNTDYKQISLPNYPWQRKYYWIKDIDNIVSSDNTYSGSRIFNRLKRTDHNDKKSEEILNKKVLAESSEKNRKILLDNYLQAHVAKVLKVSLDEINIQEPLKNLGIGSLMGMELFNRLKSDFEISLPISKFLKGPSISEISEEILTNLNYHSKNTNIPVLTNKENIPLSFSQQRLWFIEKFEPDIFIYNIPAGVKIKGSLDFEILEKSVNEIVKRHEILRTNFKVKGSQPYQYISSEKYIIIKYHEITHDLVDQIILGETSEKFDLEVDNLLRVGVIKTGQDEYIIFLTIHHIIADGISLKVFFNELINFYKSFLTNSPSQLKELPIQYSDYAVWQMEKFKANDYDPQIDYWKKKLKGIPDFLQLPTDKIRPEIQTYQGATEYFVLPDQLYKKLEELGKAQGVTLFVILLSVFKLLLSRYSGQEDIIIGTPIAGRNEPELENMIGLFLNMLAIRDQINENFTFSQLLQNISTTTIEAYDNSDIPFEKIVEIVKPQRIININPVFQVIMALHASIEIESFNDINIQSIDIDMKTSKFDLALAFIPDTTGFKGAFEYNTDLFDAVTISKMKQHYLHILENLTENPDIQLSDISLLSDQDEDDFSINFSHGAKKEIGDLAVIEMFGNVVNEKCDSIAVSDENKDLSYSDLNIQSNILAGKISNLKKKKNLPISILLDKSCDLIIALLAVLKSGNPYLPLDINHPKDRNGQIILDSQTEYLISSKKFKDYIPDGNFKIIYIEDSLDLEINHNLEVKINSDDTAYIIYTSGTTGIPKGVEISHKNLANLIAWHKESYFANSSVKEQRMSLIAGTAFDASVWEIWPALVNGISLYIPPKEITESPNKLMNWFNQNRISISFLPTPLLELLIDKDWSKNNYLKTVLTGGDKLNKKPHSNLPFRLYNHYGPTECTVVSTFCLVEAGGQITIGKPIYNFHVLILDEQLKVCPVGVAGEIYIGGQGLAKGYYNNPELTEKLFISTKFGRLYKTGDIARFLNDSNIEFIGRNDNQVKVRGVRIELGEIEKVILSHPNITNTFLTVNNQDNINQITAYVIADQDIDLTAYLNKKLPEAMIPKIIYIDSFPINANGKIDVFKLKEISLSQTFLKGNGNNLHPTSQNISENLINIWQSVLKIKNININDNFFDLGGHSLLAMELVDFINEKFQIDLSLKELFNSPNIKSLSELISQKKIQSSQSFTFSKIIHDNENIFKSFPLTDLQQAYWIGRSNSFEFGNVSSHAYLEIDIKRLDTDKLEKAINKTINRHPSLRTAILKDGTQKIIQNYSAYKLKVNDFRNRDSKAELEKIRNTMSHEILDCEHPPLFKIIISLLDNLTSRLHISIDALTADATSMIIMAKEIWSIYNNPQITFPELQINFRDYVLAEKNLFNSAIYEKSKNYWLNRLEDLPPAPQLPVIKNLDTKLPLEFKRLSYTLNKEKWESLKNIALKTGVSKSVILLTIFSKVISLWSKSQSFTLNLTFFNRLPLHKQINNIVGDFTSLILLEINDSVESLEKSCLKIQEQLLQDMDNRYIGGVWVLRELAKAKGIENALMPVVFTSLLTDADNLENIFSGELVYSITQTPQVWLDHQVTEINGELNFNWDYPVNLFPVSMMENMFNTYCNLLEKISINQHSFNSEFVFDVSNDDFFISEFINHEKTPSVFSKPVSDKLLHQLFFDQAIVNPNYKAVITSNLEFTYGEVLNRVKSLSHEIKNLKINNRDKNSQIKLIAVIMEKGWEQVVATLAIMSSGFAYLPINPEHPKDRIDYLLATCEIEIAITQENWLEKLNINKNINLIAVKDNIPHCSLPELESQNEDNLSPEDLAYVIFTSGSTGNPKGVMIDHQGVVNTILDINNRFKINSDDKVLALSSLNFDLSVYDIFGILATGATIVIPDPDSSRDPEYWLNLIKREKVTVWNSVPTLMSMLIEYISNKPERKIDSLKTVMLSGDWIPLSLPEKVHNLNPQTKIYSLGGATEASIWSIFYPVENIEKQWKSIPYGQALTNQTIYVLNNNFENCPQGVTGNIFIGGIGLAKGYYKDEDKTDKSFVIHPKTGTRLYKTGDLGVYMNDGNIEFLGREDTQVKIQGHRIELGELESVLTGHKDIAKAVVKAFNKENNEKFLVGYIQFKDKVLTDKQIIDFMESKLPCYMVPSIFVHLENIPVSPNGKIDRNLLQLPDTNKNITKPVEILNGEYVLKISEMVKKVLSLDSVNPNNDLLAMGANSIDIVKLANLLEEEFGFCPKVADIFRLKTIEQLAIFYEENKVQIKKSDSKFNNLILDSYERELFKNGQHNIRKLNSQSTQLATNLENESLFNDYHSSRVFEATNVTAKQISSLLSVLRQVKTENGFKYLYPSAGSLYPVQVYFYLKDNTENLVSGIYYYNPQNHNLFLIESNLNTGLDKNTHFFVNQGIYDSSKFTIFLIADLKAIEPIYGNSSTEYCYLEAGSISQLLRMNASKNDLGLCSIGQIDFEKIRQVLKLDEKYILLHTILGGVLSKNDNIGWSFLESNNTNDDEWEEITI